MTTPDSATVTDHTRQWLEKAVIGLNLCPFAKAPHVKNLVRISVSQARYTNRSPYPTLHLIREDSIAKAAQAFPDASAIFERNIALLEKMGHEGWDKLDIPRCPFDHGKTKASE